MAGDEEQPAPARKRSPRTRKAAEPAPAEAASGWRIPSGRPGEDPGTWEADHARAGSATGGQWVQPPRTGIRPPTPPAQPPPPAQPIPPAAPAPSPTTSNWLVASPPGRVFPPAVSPSTQLAVRSEPEPAASWAADIGAGTALAIDIGVILVMVGSFLTGTSTHSFVGSTLISEFDRGFRFRLLAVFSQASFEQAVIVLVAILLTVSVPAGRPSVLRRPAIACAAGLGVYIAVGAVLRAVALMSFLGTSAALAVGTTLSCLAAVPVAIGASVWAAVLLTRDDRERKAGH